MRTLFLFALLSLPSVLCAEGPTRFSWMGADTTIPGSSVTLDRGAGAVFLEGRVRDLEPGFAYTIWAVVFNDPSACTAGCDGGDLGEPGVSVLWSGFGSVPGPSGKLDYTIVLVEGDPPGQVLFGPGLADAQSAEVHLIVRSHGPASDDPTVLEAQLSTVGGGCSLFDCEDVQFTVTGQPITSISATWFRSMISPAVIGNSVATMERFDDELVIAGSTRGLTAGHAYTVWAVVFNDPSLCSGSCGMDDLGLASASALWSGAGQVADTAGRIDFDVVLIEGMAPGQVLFGPMLTDAEGAEVHWIVRDHGPASDDSTVLEAQLSTVGGGCAEFPCEDVQVAIFLPG